jgi:hypothetical protein
MSYAVLSFARTVLQILQTPRRGPAESGRDDRVWRFCSALGYRTLDFIFCHALMGVTLTGIIAAAEALELYFLNTNAKKVVIMRNARVQMKRDGSATDATRGSNGPTASHRRDVLRLALMIDRDGGRVRRWYRAETIAEFGGRTPQEMCALGFGGLVVYYLEQILHGNRG